MGLPKGRGPTQRHSKENPPSSLLRFYRQKIDVSRLQRDIQRLGPLLKGLPLSCVLSVLLQDQPARTPTEQNVVPFPSTHLPLWGRSPFCLALPYPI